MDMNNVSRSRILNCCELGYFCGKRTDEQYEHVAPFLHSFHIRYAHRAKVSMQNSSLLYLRNIIWFHKHTATLKEKHLAVEVAARWDKVPPHIDGPLALSFFSSKPYRRAQTRLRNRKSFCRPIKAPQRVQRVLIWLDFFCFIVIMDLKDVMLS